MATIPFLTQRKERPLKANILFPEIRRELVSNRKLVGGLRGLFIVTVKKRGRPQQDWYLLFNGQEQDPVVSKVRPSLPEMDATSNKTTPVVLAEIEDRELVNFATGGKSGWNLLMTGKLKVGGDLEVASKLEKILKNTGGVEKVLRVLKQRSKVHSDGHA
ncbi:uncharacterized protein VTP21DRAFT_1871 [Calcarisporiella thermophila]|uniref:uncharacterized protein n=1 Tax=Calcarisporiella thermophila TaxID=911321 RepID=UPI0037448A19